MPLVKAQCTNCGAALEVDNSKEAAICPFCNTPYIVEKAINNYTITNNINAQNVIINSNVDTEFLIENCVLKKYTGNKTEITIPSNVKEIFQEAFGFCKYIEKVNIHDNVIKIGKNAFLYCTSLKSVRIGNGVTEIDDIFGNCKTLEYLDLGASVSKISYKTIRQLNNLKSIIVDSINETYHVAGNCLIETSTKTLIRGLNNSKIPSDGSVTSINNYAFSYCQTMTNIEIPNSIKYIGEGAFEGCKNLKSIIIPNGITKIENGTFQWCTNLTSVTIPDSVTTIENWAFHNCTNLTNAIIPKSVTSIGPQSFLNTKVENFTQKKGGCYIATCVYGTYDCPQVWTLRRFRDNTLGATWYGRAFIRTYYAISPTVVKWFGKTKLFKKMWQGKLDRMVKKLNEKGVENTPYQDKQW